MERSEKPEAVRREDDEHQAKPTPGTSGSERVPGGGTGTPPGDVSNVGRTGPAGGERAPGGGVRLGTSIGDTGQDPDGGAPAREGPLRSDQRK